MFNGNVYGLVITALTFVIAIVLTMRQIEQTGVHVELTIRPVREYARAAYPEKRTDDGSVADADPARTKQEQQRLTQ